jgi:hypothetical protein
MACGTGRPVEFEVTLDTKGQTREKVQKIVEALLIRNNAVECGIMARFSMSFADSSTPMRESVPGSELEKLGVVSLKTSAAG